MMQRLQLHIIGFLFSAFLPPKEDDSLSKETYYDVLDVGRSSKTEDIRKAYKKKSLQYHPDKVAQFATANNKSKEEIEAEFVQIKEAYETLSNPSKRDAYDVLGLEGGRMISNMRDQDGGGLEMHLLIYNLARASCLDRTKLFSLVVLAVMWILLGPILICVKVDSSINETLYNTEWVILLIPLWFLNALFLLLFLVGQSWLAAVRLVCIFALEILLALKWDMVIGWDYRVVLIPLFVHQIVGLLENVAAVEMTRRDVGRMVTVSYLEQNILPTFFTSEGDGGGERRYADLNEAEREEINQVYIIISENPEDDGHDDDDGESDENHSAMRSELKLMYAIAHSPEFEHASMIRSQAFKSIASIVFVHAPFLVLLILKLDEERNWDWHLVFTPIWIQVIFFCLSSCWNACCGSIHERMELARETAAAKMDVQEDDITNVEEGVKIGELNIAPNANASPMKGINSLATGTMESGIDLVPREDQMPHVEASVNRTTPHQSQSDDHEERGSDFNEEGESPDLDSAAVENQVRALGSCCYYILLVITLALFLVKLNGAEDSDIDGQGDYSAFWVFFPTLFIAAIIICIFAACIYAAPAEALENMMGKKGENEDDAEMGGGSEHENGPVPPSNPPMKPIYEPAMDIEGNAAAAVLDNEPNEDTVKSNLISEVSDHKVLDGKTSEQDEEKIQGDLSGKNESLEKPLDSIGTELQIENGDGDMNDID